MLRRSLILFLTLLPGVVSAGGSSPATRGSAARPARTATFFQKHKRKMQVRHAGRAMRHVRPPRVPRRVARQVPDTRAQQRKVLAESLAAAPFHADYVDIGMGPTGMMSMLGAIATGHKAIGVEIRGLPQRGVHQNIRVDWYHTLARIDELMLETYGAEGIPKLPSGKPFILHDYFYNADRAGGHLDWHEVYGVGDEQNQNIAGRLDRIIFEDAREPTRKANGGKAKLFVLPAPDLPARADPRALETDMRVVLDSPSTFQVALINYERMLRQYLKAMEDQDRAAGRPARVKTYENHRVAVEDGVAAGYIAAPGDRRRIVIEEIVDQRTPSGRANRVRKPGQRRIDLGVPTRFSLTAGFGGGADAESLGYQQEDVVYRDPATGQSTVAKQNWLVGEVTANIGGQLIRRVSTITDPKTGASQTVRQIAVGHENAPNVAWVPVQVPDFMTFDPVDAGLVPKGTRRTSKAYAEAQKKMVTDFFVQQVSEVIHVPEADIRRMRMFYGPSFFTLRERLGKTARVARNGNVAGDLMGNGHFLTSAGSMTGMIGHGNRYIDYFQALRDGVPEGKASRKLLRGIKTDSEDWLHVSIKEFFDVAPVNFGAERARALGIVKDTSPINDAASGANHGLDLVLGQQSWATALERLQRGEFGTAGKDFYVPKEELDLTRSTDVTVHRIGVDGKEITAPRAARPARARPARREDRRAQAR